MLRPLLRRARLMLGLAATLTAPAFGGNATYNSAVLADNPVAFWSFDETSGTAAADAATTNGAQNGVYENCTLGQASAFTNLGTCPLFNGTSSRVRMPYASVFDLAAGDFSVELWYKTTVTGRGDMFNFKNAVDFGIFANDAGAGSLRGYHNAFLPGPTSGVTTNAWHHVVYSRAAGNITLYIDGVVSGSGADAVSMSATTDIIVGANQTALWFTGNIDEVAYYGSALSQARISAHYAAAQQTNPNAPVVTTAAATGLGSTAATIGGAITAVGSPDPTVTLFWGTTNGGQTPASWSNSIALGTQTGSFSSPLSGLTPATTYYFVARAQNANGESWGLPVRTFTTLNGPPVVQNVAATAVTASSATVGANVTSTGGLTPTVTLYYGQTDGGTTPGAWTSSVSLGAQSGSATTSLTGLQASKTYFFRAFAQQAAGSAWAPSSASFATLSASPPSVVTDAATDVNGFSASLRGHVISTGNDAPTVRFYYGPSDGGTNPAAWASNVTLTGVQEGAFAKAIAGLNGSTLYHARAWAQNGAGQTWAPTSVSFTTTAFTAPSVLINEIHYHPVELAAFNADGTPFLNLAENVHEFIELKNTGASAVNVGGWTISGGVGFTIPAGTTIAAGGYLVIGKNPARLQTVYAGLTGVQGPYSGTLSNGTDTVRLKNVAGDTVDTVSYGSSFPWPNGADGLGADQDFTLVNVTAYQYKGRSLERLSPTAASNDPANWLASPLGGSPSPGAANAVTAAVPGPVPLAVNFAQASDDNPVIRATQQVRINAAFSSTAGLSNVQVEYFVDNINSFVEPRSTVAMTEQAGGQFTAVLPGQADRSVVRYRIKADRGNGVEVVGPRADDAAIVPVGPTTREAWFAYFVTPARTASPNPVYDLFVSDDGTAVSDTAGANVFPFNGLNGIQTMAYNATGNPKRVTSGAITGVPRDPPYVTATDRIWNGSVPAIFIENNTVRDVHFRLHGSRYNRRPSRATYKLRFPDTEKFQGADSQFITDKSDYFSVMHGLYVNADLPVSNVRWIDWYLNGNAKVVKLEQGEYNGDLLNQFHDRQKRLNPSQPKEKNGEFYKNVGTIEDLEGPYARGDERPLAAGGPWTALQRYEWTYLLQNNGWVGPKPVKDFIEGMWTARGDTFGAPNPNVPALRAYLDSVLDVDTALTSLAILNWGCPWDDTTQNHFLWRRANGKWAHFPWDFDGFFGNGDTTGTNSWIYLGETGSPNPASNVYGTILGNNFRGPNFYKDSLIKAYRTEYNSKLWTLNNTYLHPDNLKTLFFTNSGGSLTSYYTYINSVKAGFCEARFNSVNVQTGHAADGSDFTRPTKPTNTAPTAGTTALPPATLTASGYAHSSGSTGGVNAHASSKWEIRKATGSYFEPVFVTNSTTSLTSLAIPFSELSFGDTYFWRVTYIDGQGHPSIASAETSFIFGPLPTNATLINFTDTWKFNYTIQPTVNAGEASWMNPAFNDSAWLGGTEASGKGVLAFETQSAIPGTILTTLPDPRTLSPAGRAYYFRKKFTFPANPALASNLRIRHLVDDGALIYINGTLVHRYFMNDAASYAHSAFSNGNPGEAVYQYADAVTNNASAATWTWVDPRPYLVQGENTIAVAVFQTSATSSDIVFGLEMTATLPATPGDVVINEVMADNHSINVDGTHHADWIELKNTTASAIDIGGWGLTDDILNPNRYTFPPGTSLGANGRLIVWCDSGETEPPGAAPATGPHTGFGLSRGGQRIVLTAGGQLRDYVAFGPQARDLTIGRVPDGSGSFTLTTPTLNAANIAVAQLGSSTTLKINEWMATLAHGEDWFEIFNPDPLPVSLAGLWLSDTLDSPKITQLPALSYIAGGGFADFEADGSNNGNNRCNFKLSAGGDRLILSNAAGTAAIDAVQFGAQTQNRSQGRLPDGATGISNFPGTDSRAASNWVRSAVVINEVLSNGNTPGDDFIELHNPTGSAISIGNWWISDDPFARRKYRIPAGTSIPAGGFYVVMDGTYDAGPGAFSFDSTGDHAVLTAVDGSDNDTGARDDHEFGAAVDGVSFGRVPVSGGVEFWPQVAVTKGAANSAPKTVPIIINEIQYHPADLAAADNVRDEFVELHNPTTQTVDLTGWHLEGGSDFAFPAGASIRPGDYALMLGFDPDSLANASMLADFRAQYALPTAVRLFGPFAPKLANDEATVKLSWRGTINGGIPADFMVDRVKYADYAPWPTDPDGAGASLQRVSRAIVGNDAANWTGAIPTPGAANAGQTAITDNDGDGLPNAWEDTYGLDRFSAADANVATSANGGVANLLVYALNGTPGTNAQPKLPTAAVQTLAGAPYLTLSFTHRTGNPALQFQVETTTGNGAWSPAVLVTDSPNGDGTATSLWRSATPFSASVREFIRLRVVAQ